MKKLIVAFILGGIVFGSIGIYAASYLASDISYTLNDGTKTNVDEALDNLYNSTQGKTITVVFRTSQYAAYGSSSGTKITDYTLNINSKDGSVISVGQANVQSISSGSLYVPSPSNSVLSTTIK